MYKGLTHFWHWLSCVSDWAQGFTSLHTLQITTKALSSVRLVILRRSFSGMCFYQWRMSIPESDSKSELLYNWLFTANQFVLAPIPLILTAGIFSQLNTCDHSPYITSSLTRGWVCHLQFLLALASAFILGSESRGTRDHILLVQIRDFLFVASYDSQGYGGGIRPRLHTGCICVCISLIQSFAMSIPKSKSELCYDRRFSRPIRLRIKHPSGA
jgi:hypothetical protein